MTDQPESQSSEPVASGGEEHDPVAESAASAAAGQSFKDRVSHHATTVSNHATTVSDRATTLADERPELVIGGAFAGGFLLAQILKRLAP